MAERQFHIQCTAEDIGHYVFLPGDPDRVPWIASYLENAQKVAQSREFTTYTGTLDGTRIDFPVVQGADNMVYVNTDVYGDFSLSGAIFLDSRCPADFTAPYSIVYGHHIEDGGMFGDIVQFTQSDYFAAHTTGALITDDTAYNITLFACARADAYDPVLYDPAQSPDALLAYIKAHAVQYRTPGSGPVVAFSTCTEAATNGRVLLFGQLLPQT